MSQDNSKARLKNKASRLPEPLAGVKVTAARQLEKLGSWLDEMHSKRHSTSHYQAADLHALDGEQKQQLFREQTLKASGQLVGAKFMRYGHFAKRILPEDTLDQVTDQVFIKIAGLAESWSHLDLADLPHSEQQNDKQDQAKGKQKDEQKTDASSQVANIGRQQRQALAAEVANQNRALATLGGVTGLAGLPGLLADTLWLLLVSLRCVYQLAEVHGQPLTGTKGAKIAYNVLASADLSKMQEKQLLQAGLLIGGRMLGGSGASAQVQSLTGFGSSATEYAEMIDELAERLNIDFGQLPLTWLHKAVPLTAVAVGMHYNSQLIEEVIGVAQATFAPAPKLTQSDQHEAPTQANAEQQHKTEQAPLDHTNDVDTSKKAAEKTASQATSSEGSTAEHSETQQKSSD